MGRGRQFVQSGGLHVGARRARSEDPNGPPAHTDCPPRPIFSLGRDRAKNSTGRGRTKHCTTWVTSCARFTEAHKAYTGSSPPNVIFKMSVLGHICLFLEFALCPTLQSSLNILIFCVETSKFYCRATTASPTGSPNKMHHQENQNRQFLAIFANIVLITTGKPNKLKKIHNHLKKAENFSFLQIVMDFLQLIGFARGDQNNINKNAKNC